MKFLTSATPVTSSLSAWYIAALAGVAVPVMAMLLLLEPASALGVAGGPILTLSLMGVGIIAAAAAGQVWVGFALALLSGACLIMLALAVGMPLLLHPLSTALAMMIAGISFAARGALFARSLQNKGWLMAVFVVAGEGAVLLIAFAAPGALPDWFLALLPAQWSSLAIQSALTGTGTPAAMSCLIALAGTAATTLLAARLFPRPWPYLLMFTAWLSLSALVYYQPAPSAPLADPAAVGAAAGPIASKRTKARHTLLTNVIV